MIVVDSSAIITLSFQRDGVRNILENERDIHTLDLAFYEVANAFIKKVARKELTVNDAKVVYEKIKEFFESLKIHSVNGVIDEAFKLALDYNTTVYDASFCN